MNQYLTPDAIQEIRRNISRSLADTFQLMFHLDIFLLPAMASYDTNTMVCSYMDMSYQNSGTRLTLAITRTVIEHIAGQLEPEVTNHSQAVIQDIVCEITNIVGNHLRSHLFDKVGIEIEIGLPQIGHAEEVPNAAHILNLQFRIREDDNLDLDFSYTTSQQVAV